MSNESVRVFAIGDQELKEMMTSHAASVQESIDGINARLLDMPGDGERSAPVQSQREVLLESIKALEQRKSETLFLSERIAPGSHRMSGAELTAFKRIYGKLVVDIDALKWAPRSAPGAETQAERALGSTLVQVPRLVMPPGALER